MIEVANLTKYYGDRRVLHGISFTVERGRVCGFLGPNGSGKSTTMDILAGILGPSDGVAKVSGVNVLENPRAAKAKIGYLPDSPPLFEEMRVRDFVDYVARLHQLPGNARRTQVERVLQECDVLDVSNRIIGHLSKGYKQRVAMCAALVHSPEVLILDEPTEGLDPMQIVQIRHLIRKLSQDRTVILSSHILPEVQEVCDEVIIICEGHIAAQTSLAADAEDKRPYLFSFAGNVSSAAGWLRSQNYVQQIESHDGDNHAVLVHFKPDFFKRPANVGIAEVNAELIRNGFAVSGIRQHAVLESLFFNAIKNVRSSNHSSGGEVTTPAAAETAETGNMRTAQQEGN